MYILKKSLIALVLILGMQSCHTYAINKETTLLMSLAIGATTGAISAQSEMPWIWNWIIESIARNALVSGLCYAAKDKEETKNSDLNAYGNTAWGASWLTWLLLYTSQQNKAAHAHLKLPTYNYYVRAC